MKPNFALSLSFQGIRLLHRVPNGWRQIGEVAVDAEDMAAELATLRATATALEPSGLRSKVLIPNDQIKFMSIDTAGLDGQARREAAERALDGATPYAVTDLVFDTRNDGPITHIAAVARETLIEAEAFATEHRFHPVSFVAQAGDHDFKGEAFFGPTDTAFQWLKPGEEVEPDTQPLVILDDVAPPEEKQSQSDPIAETSVAPPKTDLGLTAPIIQAEAEATPLPPKAEKPAPKASAAPERTRQQSSNTSVGTAAPDAHPVAQSVTPPLAKPSATAKAPAISGGKTSTASVESKVPPALGAPTAAPSKSTPAAPAATKVTADFSSRRSAPRVAAAVGRGHVQPLENAGGPVPDSSSLTGAKPARETKASPFAFLKRLRSLPVPPRSRPTRASAPAVAGKTRAKDVNEADRMTVFGARNDQTVGGKPRFLALALTAALLVFLAGVAAWASVFLDDGLTLSRIFGTRDTTQTASAAPTAEPKIVQSTKRDVAPPAPSKQANDTTVAALAPLQRDESDPVLDATPAPQTLRSVEMTAQEIEAKYATTGIWALAPKTPQVPAILSLDNVLARGLDPVSTSNKAMALPKLASFGGDVVDIISAPPATAGTTFKLDDRGLVIPSEKGTLNADGVIVFAGRPARVPPATLARPDAPKAAEVIEASVDSAPPKFRPKLRPEEPAEATDSSNPETTNLVSTNSDSFDADSAIRNELAALRPTARSAQVIKAAAAAQQAEVDAAAKAAAEALKAALPQEPVNNATRYATDTSKRPDLRPGNFSRLVRRAERAQPMPVAVASAAKTVTPQVVKPAVPSKTSVSKQATVKNAIKLRTINLIGVYGKPSSRRALIRLSNGRYQKVAVGDRLDGGRVSAIGESELRYNRRGRDVVLKMPRG
ncbi:hypothetical protein [Sulfitobacter litoralis]|uniref:hypothetical protein n=1 Tax=Sulfitobacter litoralis TaxID=335975 RepID=UPI002B27965E|nr:hypothetical protein [Sulfitobacter litoralis]